MSKHTITEMKEDVLIRSWLLFSYLLNMETLFYFSKYIYLKP